MDPKDILFIAEAARYFERRSFAVSAANIVGKPVEFAVDNLPVRVKEGVATATRKAMEAALKVAVQTLDQPGEVRPDPGNFEMTNLIVRSSNRGHTVLTAVLGGVSGFLGGWTIGAELPLTTTIMMRAIADTAKRFGEDVSRPEVQLECMSIFALGSKSPADDAMESAYYTARIGLGALVKDAAAFVAGKSGKDLAELLAKRSAPIVSSLLVRIAQRFKIVVSEKLIAQAVPVVGAVGGATLNTLFTEHYNKVAMYHFGLKNLERKYGVEVVRSEYLGSMNVVSV